MRGLLTLSLLMFAALAFAGCSSSGDRFLTPAQNDDGEYVIKMTSGNRFSPQYAKVPAGATVAWVSVNTHNVIANDGSFTSEDEFPQNVRDGQTYRHTFDTPGTFDYKCTLHAGMVGTLKVEATTE